MTTQSKYVAMYSAKDKLFCLADRMQNKRLGAYRTLKHAAAYLEAQSSALVDEDAARRGAEVLLQTYKVNLEDAHELQVGFTYRDLQTGREYSWLEA